MTVHASLHARSYPVNMPSIQIRNVPEDTHRALKSRAAAEGRSLQDFLRRVLEDEAGVQHNRELFDRIEREASGGSVSMEDILHAIDEGRAGR